MQNDRGNLSIDFLAGFTIFMLALIWVATMIPGLLIGVQSRTIDVDAISYRTGVILTEDPGMPISPPWENKNDYQKSEVERFGLATSKDTPNILKMAKIERFFCSTSFSYPTDYKDRLIFGDRPYGFNITLSTFDGVLTRSLGDLKPEEYGYIRRLVKIKYPSNTTIDAQTLKNSANVSQHVFSIELNCTELIGNEPNYMYQINPRRDQIMVNFTNLSGARVFTSATNRITLNSIDIYRRNPLPPYTYSKVTTYENVDPKFKGYLDGSGVTATLPSLVNDNVSVLFSSGYFYGMADDYSILRIDYTFNLTDPDNFFNNSFTAPYSYNYSPAHVTQPRLMEGVLEVATWTAPFGSYAPSLITATPTPVQPPVADFYGTPRTGGKPLLVAFTDMTTGVPMTWNWTFGDIGAGNTSKLQHPTHTYTSVGSYSVNLTVSNVYGGNTLIKTNYITVGLKIPIPAFTANTTSGTAPLPVTFTDATTNSPTIWNWTFGDIGAGNTSTLQNPTHTYTKTGRYTVNLTTSNGDGNATLVKTNYITVNPVTSWKCDVTGWNYRKNITIDKSKVPADQTNFPVLINLASDSDLKNNARSDAYDILFTASDGTTKLSHEIESYTSSTGALVAWVKVPSISSAANTTIFMYYGCATATDQQDKNNVWDANYAGIWHLNTVLTDSTSNSNNGRDVGTTDIAGKISNARNFSGTQYIDAGGKSSLNITGNALTTEAWIYANPWDANYWMNTIIGKDASTLVRGYGLRGGSNDLSLFFGDNTNWQEAFTTSNPMATTTWYHVVGRYNGTFIQLYINGAPVISAAAATNIVNANINMSIGNGFSNTRPFKGRIDEVRVSNLARSDTWIKTEYNNQNSPSTFYSVSSEEGWSCEATPTPTPTTATPTPTPTPAGPWYCGWWFRKNITIQHAQVSGTNGNFPVLINLGSDADLAARALTSGNDILFTASDGTTKLSHEIEAYTSGSGALVAWVKVPSVTSATDTTIMMYYGNAGAASQQDKNNVWDSNFKGVWHLNTVFTDSTSNAITGTNAGSSDTTGMFARGRSFDGTNDEIACTDINAVDGATQLTVEAWIKPADLDRDNMIVTKGTFATNQELLMWRDEIASGRTNTFSALVGTGSAQATYYGSSGKLDDNNWHYVVVTYLGNSATGLRGYIDGVEDTAQSPVSTTSVTSLGGSTTDQVRIGSATSGSGNYLSGLVDEVRISSTVRTADWILTGYRNQNNPSAFYSLNSQQQGSC